VKGSFARRMHLAAAGLAVSVSVASFTACGGSPSPATESPEQRFAANTAGLIDQLHKDVTISTAEGSSLVSARKALRNPADLLAMLVAYTDFGSCRKMVRNTGNASSRFGQVEAALGSACALLERAATLFTDAATRSDPQALLAATRVTGKATPLLYRAKVELDAANGSAR
jgi:hypothetical protein